MSALPVLYRDVERRMQDEDSSATHFFGWRVTAQHAIGARIIWIPGNTSGKIGIVGAPKFLSQSPRQVGSLPEMFHCVIQDQNPRDPENEEYQYEATRCLFDSWYACCLASQGPWFRVVDNEWFVNRTERRFGAAIRVTCTLETPILRAPTETLVTDVPGRIDLTELDHTAEVLIS